MKKIIGVSESIGRRREWRHDVKMIHQNVCPALRSVDYKLPKNVWIVDEEDNIA